MNSDGRLDILNRIEGRCDVTTGVDLVFVHGAEADAEHCWHPKDKPELSFPRMLASDLPYACSWSLSYTSTLYRRKGYTLRLGEQATQTLRELANRSIGRRPVIFVAHSVGGLLIKHVLRLATESRDPQWQRIVEQTRGVVFLSTPHFGFRKSRLTSLLTFLPNLNDNLLTDVIDQKTLHALNDDFIAIVAKHAIDVQVYYEGKPTPRLLWLGKLVSKASANPHVPGVQPTVVLADHDGLCKPAGPNDHIYVSVRQFVRRCFAGEARDVFISYAHEDASSVDALRKELSALIGGRALQVWTDRVIEVGDSWETEILKHMERSCVAVFMLSPAFLMSEFIMLTELPFLRRKADAEGSEIIVVPLAPVDLERSEFQASFPEGAERGFGLNDVQWASAPERPVASMSSIEKNAFFRRLAENIVAAADRFSTKQEDG